MQNLKDRYYNDNFYLYFNTNRAINRNINIRRHAKNNGKFVKYRNRLHLNYPNNKSFKYTDKSI